MKIFLSSFSDNGASKHCGKIRKRLYLVWLFLNLTYQEAILTLCCTKPLSQACNITSSVVHWGHIKKYVLHEYKSNTIPRKHEAIEQKLYMICH